MLLHSLINSVLSNLSCSTFVFLKTVHESADILYIEQEKRKDVWKNCVQLVVYANDIGH